jgi:hypothetical protein
MELTHKENIMAEEAEEIWCVYFQKDGHGSDTEDPNKPKRLYLFDNTDGVVWHNIEEDDTDDMKAMIQNLQENFQQYAILVIPNTACTTDENGILNGITFPSEFTGFAGS